MLLLAAPFSLAAPSTPTEDFTDNLDGTVTHRITGLTWMRCAMGMTWDGATCTGTASTYTWDEAIKLTANFARKSDWRLPSIAELNTIVERETFNSAINNTVFPNTPPYSYFWSRTPYAGSSDAWVVLFFDGGAYNDNPVASRNVRLVHVEQSFDHMAPYTPSTAFVDNNDGTVTHTKTGLMWKRCAEGQVWSGATCAGYTSFYDKDTAVALSSSSADHSDWRIPTVNELLTIVEYQAAFPAVNSEIFPNSSSSYFWSRSNSASNSSEAWIVDLRHGDSHDSGLNNLTKNFGVRLVRNGQFFSPLGFIAKTDVAPGTLLNSGALKITPGSSSVMEISIVGGSYAINGGSYTSASGKVYANDSVTVQVTSSSAFATTTRATLTVGGLSGNFSVSTRSAPDKQSPSVPTNLTANSSDNNKIDLSWNAATDNTGVSAYQVYRNDNWLTSLGAVTSFTDTGLTANTLYSYRVVACDTAGNCSPQSALTTSTTLATTVLYSTTPTEDFTDNGDGTVTHRITGLTWMRCAIGMTWTGTTCTGTASPHTWDEATKMALHFAGKSDWRLPSFSELTTIVERGTFEPAVNVTAFPNTPSSKFWSGSPFVSNLNLAWAVDFYVGDSSIEGRANYGVMVRLVRGGSSFDPLALSTPSSDFFDNNDGTVTHLKTGLMWKRCPEGQIWSGVDCTGAPSGYNWVTAVALKSSTANYSDWRIPTEGELLTIVEYNSTSNAVNTVNTVGTAINTAIFANTGRWLYWSSSPNIKRSDQAWGVEFGQGSALSGFFRRNVSAVRLVRAGQFFGPWGFAAQTKVDASTSVTSNAFKIFGSGGKITISGGQYSINSSPYTSAPGTINPNDTITVRVTSASSPGTTTRTTLTIGNISGDFIVTTAVDAQAPLTPASLNATHASSPTGTPLVKLTWPATTDNTAVTHYRINRNGSLLAVVNNPNTTYTDTQLVNSSQFTYTVQACDAAYNCSLLSNRASAAHTGAVSSSPQLTTGAGHSAGIRTDAGLFTWGFNEAGQLGTGANGDPRTNPQHLGSGYTAVAAGASHNLAIKLDGSLWTWGGNASGQLGDGTTSSHNVPIQIGSGYMSVAAGNRHSLGIKIDGTLWSWGNNGTGQLGNGTSNSTSTPIQIGTGFYFVSAGTSHTVAIKTDGTLWAWGSNNFGQLGDGTGNDRYAPNLIGSGFTVAAAGAFHTIALKNDGTLWAWGQNTNGQLGDNTTQNRYTPVQVGSGYSAVSANGVTGTLAAGSAHSLALKPNGNLWAWGSNASGQLGDGTTTDSLTPKSIDPASVFTTVAANANHSLALNLDGTVRSWGANSTGQLGDATLASRLSSVLVLNETVDGALDLIPGVANTIPTDKLPSFLMQVVKSSNVTSTVKYNPTDLNQSGSVYIVAYLRPDSPLLLTSVQSTSKSAGSALTKDTGCPTGNAGTVPAVLTRGGWKQADCTTPTLPLYTGTLNTANNTFPMYDAGKFDPTKDNGLFCVAYAGASTTSAKGLIRSVVSGLDANLNICPPIQIGASADTTAPSIPLNITATAAGPGQVSLTWNAATDNTAVVRYNIYRGDTMIATLNNVTSYTDSSPQASTNYSYSVMACDAAANCSGQSTPVQTNTPAQPNVMLGAGWNLVGNGGSTAMNVASLFGDASKIYSLWKWVKVGSAPDVIYPAWAFYTPGQADSGAAYAASKGYDTFTSITSGEGFWVNAKTAFSVPMTAPAWILSSVFAHNQSKALTPGWSLIATGEAQTASAFNKAMSATPPAAGVIPINLTSLWAWQNSAQRWYFYAPSLDASGGLNTYLNEMNFLDLGGVSFAPTMGFWVNR
jgi:alpha-tubulin suppressor-like RCC1 family protein/fibronectin type 3 domain-containing protein